jgi:competence protein ComEA
MDDHGSAAGALIRPAPRRTAGERCRAWLAWFGTGRLVAGAVSTMIVVGGAWWLVRTPAPPTEATLPVAHPSGASASTVATSVAADVSTGSMPGFVPAASASAPSSTVASDIVVHVAGAVADPGVHELAAGSRVVDAISAAGGPLPDADADRLNLAAVLTDAARVYVPRVDEVVPGEVAVVGAVEGDGASTGETDSSTAAGPEALVDLNRAGVDELDELPGIGPATAAAIVAHRQRAGPFASVDDLLDVRGIGPAKLDAIRGLVTV